MEAAVQRPWSTRTKKLSRPRIEILSTLCSYYDGSSILKHCWEVPTDEIFAYFLSETGTCWCLIISPHFAHAADGETQHRRRQCALDCRRHEGP